MATNLTNEIMKATLANRSAKLADSVLRANTLLRMLEAMPRPNPTMRERIRWRVNAIRRRVGFWIAGHDPDQD